MKSDIEIAQAAKMKPIKNIARQASIKPGELKFYGEYKAKLKPEL